MHIGDTPDEAAFRAEARAWLNQHAPAKSDGAGELGEHDLAAHIQKCRDWQRVLFEHGWAGITWPKKFGGRGASAIQSAIFAEEMSQFDVSTGAFAVSIGMVGPTLIAHGTPEQQERHLAPILRGDEVWCQLFSEPGSGSDLASLGTRAVRDGDEWIVNGQKVWTTLAHLSKWGLLVVRTDPDTVKHAGLTAFVVDMQAPGVEVRPLRQMTGEAEFNEVYFTDTRIPEAEMLGAPGDGWRVSLTTLMNERVSIGGTIPQKGSGPIAHLVRVWGELPAERRNPATLDALMKLWSRAEVLRLTNIRANQMRKMGDPGPEGSIGKMASADLNKDIYSMVVDLLGADGMLYGSYEMIRPETAMGADTLQKAFLRSRANSIEGGTTEVMKNILGERVLGLPGDVRVDREVPWSQVPRN